jgi:uncharacterized protein (TIGR02001 family)
MKSICRVLAAALVLAGLGGSGLQAQDESPVSVSIDVGFVNQYLWRGFVLNPTPSVQPGISVGYKDFTISSWSNVSHTGPNGQNWTEHDLTLDYTKGFGKNSVSVGYINYAFPDLEDEAQFTHELYFGYAYDTILSPSITVYRDVDDGDGWYYYASIGHSVPLPKGLSLNPSLGLGVNQHQWISQTAVSNFDVGASLDIPVGHVTFSPFFTRMIGNTTLFGSHNMWGMSMSIAN